MSDDLRKWAGPIPSPSASELADRYAIGQFARVYALGIDTREYDLTRSVFAADAFVEGTGLSGPIDEYLPKIHAGVSAFKVTQHNITNQYIALDGDEALLWSYAIAVHKVMPDATRPDFTLGVQYRDTCRRFPAGWQIVRRKVVLQWSEQGPAPGSKS